MDNKIQINFTEQQIQNLREEKEKLGLSIGGIVRLAVTKYFNSEEAQ